MKTVIKCLFLFREGVIDTSREGQKPEERWLGKTNFGITGIRDQILASLGTCWKVSCTVCDFTNALSSSGGDQNGFIEFVTEMRLVHKSAVKSRGQGAAFHQ